jgi:putative transposase
MTTTRHEVQVFDPSQDVSIITRQLPHWSQAGTISFITWRTWDSLPKHVIQAWETDRDAWLVLQGITPSRDWQTVIRELTSPQRIEYQRRLSKRWNEQLDCCHGQCVLRRPELASILAKSLLLFDGDRYELTDFVVMPNHVHLLGAFPDETSMLRQCESWKHYTARQINLTLGRSGRFWQQDGFDHLVRSIEQFEYLRGYIAENPNRSKLKPGEYIHWSKAL